MEIQLEIRLCRLFVTKEYIAYLLLENLYRYLFLIRYISIIKLQIERIILHIEWYIII